MATNTHVFTGLDGTISLSPSTAGPEGDAAKAVNDTYSLTPIGRATAVNVQVVSEVKPFHELGRRYATELRARQRQRLGHDRPRARQRRAARSSCSADGRRPDARRSLSSAPSFNLSASTWRTAGFPGKLVDGHGAQREARRLVVLDARGRLRARAGLLPGAVGQRRGQGRLRRRAGLP